MKYFQCVMTILLVVVSISCKKTTSFTFTQADLIGTWTEVSPCLSPNHCYNIQFHINDTVIEYGGGGPNPDTFVSAYRLFDNNTIQMDQIIAAQGNTGNMTYQISGDTNNLTILGFLPTVNSYTGAASVQNIHLKKN